KSCDRRVRPHPPPRRSGGPPGCLHHGRTVIFIGELTFFRHPAHVRAYVARLLALATGLPMAWRWHRKATLGHRPRNAVDVQRAALIESHLCRLAPSYVADAIRAGAPRFGFKPSRKVTPIR